MTTTTTDLANIPLPAGAVRVHDWDDTQTPTAFRCFVGSSRIVDRPHRDTDMQARRV
jgi:hypothetical protein